MHAGPHRRLEARALPVSKIRFSSSRSLVKMGVRLRRFAGNHCFALHNLQRRQHAGAVFVVCVHVGRLSYLKRRTLYMCAGRASIISCPSVCACLAFIHHTHKALCFRPPLCLRRSCPAARAPASASIAERSMMIRHRVSAFGMQSQVLLPTWVTAKTILASQDSETMRVTMIL